MAKGFEKLRLSGRDMPPPGPGLAGIDRPADTGEHSNEDAARQFVLRVAAADDRPFIRSMAAVVDETPDAAAPQLVKLVDRTEPITSTAMVHFQQSQNDIPVFGSRVVVELDDNQETVSASMDLAALDDVDLLPGLSGAAALSMLATSVHVEDLGMIPDPQLTILPHPHQNGRLYLTWHFRGVPAEPIPSSEDDSDEVHLACFGDAEPLQGDYDFFLDAHNGEVLYFFPKSAHLDIPTRCQGEDEDGVNQSFFGRLGNPGFAMENPFEDVNTYDLGLQPIETTPIPVDTVRNATSDWQNSNPAAVSAHVNATRVLEFLFRILRRNSIDDQGMVLQNIVNCASNQAQNPPEWINAVWWQGRMWYGQEEQGDGSFVSLSRYLDIIGHELFHGVTEHTAGLVYESLPGALNESFSDIFGVIIRNWHLAPNAGDVATWTWDIGPGLGSGGGPMRSMSNPSSVGRWRRPDPNGPGDVIVNGYPDHMNQHVVLPATRRYDWGGVHIFSNIHNLAAHNVLTTRKPDNSVVFSPEEVAILYYLVLTRLGSLSEFDDARAELLVVSDTVYAGDAVRQQVARSAIESSYDAVGIN
ncbi:MAG: M4 family metallopeptidase [Gammaproteobacteria bacterium]|nr:M4 family metallopeptidase [Gammaproteobacteria bacterium]